MIVFIVRNSDLSSCTYNGENVVNLNFEGSGGLIPVIIQDYDSLEVLMLAFMNKDAFYKTLQTGMVWYYSRTRNRLWLKGETSGFYQRVKEIMVNCEENSLLIKIEQLGGAACHEGYKSCYFRTLDGVITQEKVFDPSEVYEK